MLFRSPMTRSRTKLLEQQVNSLLVEYDVYNCENFILPKSMHLCMIRFIDNTNILGGGGHQGMDGNIKEPNGNMMTHGENMKTTSLKCLREEREAGAHGEGEENMGASVKTSSWRHTRSPSHSRTWTCESIMAASLCGSVCNKLVEPNRVGIG